MYGLYPLLFLFCGVHQDLVGVYHISCMVFYVVVESEYIVLYHYINGPVSSTYAR